MRKFATKQTKPANNMHSLCCCFRLKPSTMHGKKTLLWSTSSLAKRPLWVRSNYETSSYFSMHEWLDYCPLILLLLSLSKVFFSVEMERRIRMGPIEFISSLGGLFGLCLGFSFISFFEIVYWAIKAVSRSFFIISIGWHSLIQE